jgi:hypothetical protein
MRFIAEPIRALSDYFSFDIRRFNASLISDGESTLVVSLVIIRPIALIFSSLEKVLVENRLKRRLTISNLESLLGSITHIKIITLEYKRNKRAFLSAM